MSNSQSTVTLQDEYDALIIHADIKTGLDAAGYSMQPMVTIANDVMNEFLAQSFDWKFNAFNVPQFYTNSFQQDYAVYGVTNLGWLQRGIVIQINSNSVPKPWAYVETGREQTQSTSAFMGACPYYSNPLFIVSWIPNDQLYYGTWGAADSGTNTLGNNPQPNQLITSPLGAGISMPTNPINQILDANGNYLVLTTYGTTGATAPSAAADSDPGTTVDDGSCVWTVLDPNGQGFRINPPPSQTGVVWQFNLVGQMIPPRFVTTESMDSQTLAPIPDSYEPHFRAGCYANAIQYSPEAKVAAKFPQAWMKWKQSLIDARKKSDRERDEFKFVASRSIVSVGGAGALRYPGAGNPFYPSR